MEKKVQQLKHLLSDAFLLCVFSSLFPSFLGEKHDEHNVQHEKHQAAYVVAVLCCCLIKDHSGYLEPDFSDIFGISWLLTSAIDFYPHYNAPQGNFAMRVKK